MNIDGLIEEFAAHLSDDPNTSPRTAEFYEADLKEFARFLAEKEVREVEDVGVGSVMEFRNRLLGENRKRFTVYRKDAAVRRFLDWVRTSTDAGLDLDPIEPMHQPLDQRITFLEDDEAAQLLSFPVRERDDARDAAVVRLMLDTGVTVSEIRGLLKSDVDLEAAQIQLGGPSSHLAPPRPPPPRRDGRSRPSLPEDARRRDPGAHRGPRREARRDLQVPPERHLEALR